MIRLLWCLFFLFGYVVSGNTAEVIVTITDDSNGELVKDAVVSVHPVSYKPPLPKHPPLVVMDQINKEFIPHVLPVVIGTAVSFPNRDQIRHHVYSIDEVKPFELPLYKGTPTEPVIFDMPGEVSLGCNIHDHMSGYIYVLDTPWYAKSGDDGVGKIKGVPGGKYELRIWHPRIKKKNSYTKVISLTKGQFYSGELSIKLRRVVKKKARVRSRSGGY